MKVAARILEEKRWGLVEDWLEVPAEPVVISYKKWGQIIDMNGTLFQPERQTSFKSNS
jgi:hypothetical protein